MTKPQLTLSDSYAESAMRRWVRNVVVDLGFCPFAAAVLKQPDALLVKIVDGDSRERLQWLLDTLYDLQQKPAAETVLMVMPEGLGDFEEFLDFAALADAVLEQHGFCGEFQLATFHPDYLFAEEPLEQPADGAAGRDDDAANYTNRSPYPALHILREQSITDVLKNVAEPERIPERNIRYARSIGSRALAQRLRNCFDAIN